MILDALLGNYRFLTGGPDADMARDLMGKFSALSGDCADAAYVMEGASSRTRGRCVGDARDH